MKCNRCGKEIDDYFSGDTWRVKAIRNDNCPNEIIEADILCQECVEELREFLSPTEPSCDDTCMYFHGAERICYNCVNHSNYRRQR